MKTCRIDATNRIKLVIRKSSIGDERIVIVSCWDENEPENEYPVTLKDIAIIMYAMTGCGVTEQLAHELSQRIGIDTEHLDKVLVEIFSGYFEMSDEQAFEKYESYFAPKRKKL